MDSSKRESKDEKILTTSDLIFPESSTFSVHSQLTSIKKSTLSITNRLRSIERDADFVRWVAAHYGRTSSASSHYGGFDGIFDDPVSDLSSSSSSSKLRYLQLIANERCGSWYIPPTEKTGGSSYWKSTDGHWGVWNFSLRRLNLNVLSVLAKSSAETKHGGAIVVDSTRQGKQLPDAFSKTVPIWCAVINRLLFPDAEAKFHQFNRCEQIISASEAQQIDAKLPTLVNNLKELDLDVVGLRSNLAKPVKCFWIARGLGLMPPTPFELWQESQATATIKKAESLDFHPLYLCMASEYQESATESSYSGYVQGAGDDAEAWAGGLTPELFWEHRQQLLQNDVAEEDLPEIIHKLVLQKNESLYGERNDFRETCSIANGQLVVGSLMTKGHINSSGLTEKDILIVCSSVPIIGPPQHMGKRLLHLKCSEGKVGSRNLRTELEKIPPFIAMMNSHRSEKPKGGIGRIFVGCETGKDLSVGVGLALLCLYFDKDCKFLPPSEHTQKIIDKALIRRKLSLIVTAAPSANPSRATLNSVNSFLMKP